MGRKITKSHLSRDEICLLKNSEEPKNVKRYGNLFEILLELPPKAISVDEIPDLDDLGRIAIIRNKKSLMEIVNKEWAVISKRDSDSTQETRCGLCNRPNKYIFFIKNRINGTILNVGSRCMENFPDIEGYIDFKQKLASIQKEQKRVERRNEFYNHFPDYETILSGAENYFSNLPILLPYSTYIKLQNVVKRMRLICSLYINENKKPFKSNYDSFTLFQLAINEYIKSKKYADSFVNENKDKPLMCERSEINWLLSNNKLTLLKEIAENNGVYTLRTLKLMCCESFIRKHYSEIFNKNQSRLMSIKKIKERQLFFTFNKAGYQPNIIFSAYIKDFMQYIGANCVMDKNYSYSEKDILKVSKITSSFNNLTSILDYIDDMMNQLNYVFLLDDLTKDLFLYRKADRSVQKIASYTFIDSYSNYILLSDDEIQNHLFLFIKNLNVIKWITPEIQVQQGMDSKIYRLYKEYKESSSYSTQRLPKNKFKMIVYDCLKSEKTDSMIIDFNKPKYITFDEGKLNISNSQKRNIHYGIVLPDDSLEPRYHKDDVLFIQSTSRVMKNDMIFFSSQERIGVIKCNSEKSEEESIFNYIDVPKKKLKSFGKIVCSYQYN